MSRNRLSGALAPVIETKRKAPVQHPCPSCGKKGRRKRTRTRTVQHLAHQQPLLWKLVVGVYAAACTCSKYFTAQVEGVALRCGFTDAVRQKVVDLLIRDHLSVYKVQRHLKEDFLLHVSIGFIYDCFQWAYARVDRAAYWQWVLQNFSGVLCIDEVHDCGRSIFVATDPVNDFTAAFLLAPRSNQRHISRFLRLLKKRGLVVRVAVTDGANAYKRALIECWEGLEHQLCLFHFLHLEMMDLLTAVRRIRRRLKVNPSHGRGRVPKRGRPRKPPQWRGDFVYEHAHLLVMRPEKLTADQHQTLGKLYDIDRRLATIRDFSTRLHEIFQARSAQAARNRRTRLLGMGHFRREPLLEKALERLADDSAFEKLIVSLRWHRVPRTNNHVERRNRAFRLVQKTRYKRRRHHMIKRAYWLHLLRDQKNHPLLTDRKVRPARIRRKSQRRRAQPLRKASTSRRERRQQPLRRSA